VLTSRPSSTRNEVITLQAALQQHHLEAMHQQLANLLALLAAGHSVRATATVQLVQQAPSYARPLCKDIVGLSIELDNWTKWAGEKKGSPNKYLNQVLSNLQSRTGVAVPIRIGANSEDRAFLAPDIEGEKARWIR